MQAAISAYFATRQWVQAVRMWVGDDDFWRRAQEFRGDKRELEHDLEAGYYLSVFSGPLGGSGEPAFADHPGPGGSLLDVRAAARDYYARGKTQYRAQLRKTAAADGRSEADRPARPGSLQPGNAANDQLRRAADLQVRRRRARRPRSRRRRHLRARPDRRPADAIGDHRQSRQLQLPQAQRALHLVEGDPGAGRRATSRWTRSRSR